MEPETPPVYRPLSGTELSWCRSVPIGTGITVLALHFSKPIPIPILQTALHKLQNSHPVLSSTLTSTSISPLPENSPPLQIQTAALPQTPSQPPISRLHAVVERELNLNPWAKPEPDQPVIVATVYDETVLAFRAHTAVCDRVAAAAVLRELVGVLAGRGAEAAERGKVNLGIEDLIRKEDSWKPFWARGKDILGYSLNGLRSSGLIFEDADDLDRRSEVVRLVLGKMETMKLLDACKAKGVKLCGVLTAAGLMATYSSKHLANNQPEVYSIVTLINCRKFLDPVLSDRDVGFYHSGILNTHTVNGEEGLWELAMRCHKAYSDGMSNKKHLTDIGDLNFLMCKAIDNPQLTPSSSLRTALMSVFEEPVIYEASELQCDLDVQDYIGCASVHGVGPSIAVFDMIRDGQLDCTFVYPSPLHSRKQMSELVGHMERILTDGSQDVDDAEVVVP